MKLKEFEKVQRLIKNYHELKTLIANAKICLNVKDDKRDIHICVITSFFSKRFLLTKEETNMVLSRLENELLGLKSKIKELGVEIDNDK